MWRALYGAAAVLAIAQLAASSKPATKRPDEAAPQSCSTSAVVSTGS
jgi:hypothetical protein